MMTSYSRAGLVFDVRDEGPEDGDPVVLLHGFPQRASCWDLVVPQLHQAGLRTLAPDQRGYSPGARPRGRWSYRMPALVEDVVALIERVGRPVHVVGHDWGAMVAWALAATRPELVRTLTAVSVPHPAAFFDALVKGDQLKKSWYIGMFNVPFLMESVVRMRPDTFDVPLLKGGMGKEQVVRVHEEIVDDGALPYALAWYRALPLSVLTPGRPDWLKPVVVPTTYVWSTKDAALGRDGAERCADHVRGDYRYVELEGVSHWVPERAPDALVEAILARVATAR